MKRAMLLAALLALFFLPGCYAFSRSKHSISPPETKLERTTTQTIPSKKAGVIWEIDITPPANVFPSDEWEEVRP